MQDYDSLLNRQRSFFASGATLPFKFRLAQLKKLKKLLHQYEEEILLALQKDLGKSPIESAINEVLLLHEELDLVLAKLKKWMHPRRVVTPFPELWPAKSTVRYEPYGIVCIIAPWNYPLLLLLSPLIGAISAGNCAILKPSEISQQTQQLISKIINENFASEYLYAVAANAHQTEQLLQQKFDYLFFTGSRAVGKMVMQAAAEHLTPITLELGGKSPCIVDETADLPYAARRIIWGKMMNAGQTCIAPDYLYVQENCKEKLIKYLKKSLQRFYGDNPASSNSFARIINQKHFERLQTYLKNADILIGGETNPENFYIAPTIMQSTWDDPVMQDEIFGPILPILTFQKIEEVFATLKNKPKPLALYLFSNDKSTQKKIFTQLSFGGGCINDCMLQIANVHLPFGGVGQSGMGHYRGRYSFLRFSHAKSIYRKTFAFETKLEYPPYTAHKLRWIKRLLGF